MYRVAAVEGRPSVSLGCVAGLLVALLLHLFAHASRVDAQASASKRLVVLRGDASQVDDALREEIDRAIVESMTGHSGFSSVDPSPVPFEEVALAAGCDGREADCLQRIAATLEADWLMVRELSRDREGNAYLTLVAHDGPDARITRRAVAEVSEHPQTAPSRVVPLLIERLYPASPAVSVAAEDAPAQAAGPLASSRVATATASHEGRWSTLRIIGVSTIGAGAIALTSGVTLWALSRRDAREYESAEIRTKPDVDEAVDLHDRAGRRGRLGRGLVIGGTLAAVAGAVTLLSTPLWHPRSARHGLSVGLAPTRGGMNLAVSGAWRGGIR